MSGEQEDFRRAIKNQTIKEVARRAKWIVIGLTSLKLVVHLRMSGHLFVAKKKTDELDLAQIPIILQRADEACGYSRDGWQDLDESKIKK